MKKIKLIAFCFKEVYSNGTALFWLFIFKSLLSTGRIYLSAWLSRRLINELAAGIGSQRITSTLIILAFIIILVDIFFAFFNLGMDYFSEISAIKYSNQFNIKNSEKCSRLKFQFHDSPSDKDELKQFWADSASVVNIYSQTITIIFTIGSFIASLFISLSFSVSITVLSLIIAIPGFFVRKYNKNADYKFEKQINLTDRIIGYYKSVCTAKAFYKETHLYKTLGYFFDLLKEKMGERLLRRKELSKSKAFREAVLVLVYSFVNIVVNLQIILFIILKKLTIGDYTYYTSIINNLKNNTDTIVSSVSAFLLSLKKAENYYTFFYSTENEYASGSQPMPEKIESIEFSNVWFCYPNSQEYVIKDISFHVKNGEAIAFAGLNGAGKTTLINLILRFYEPTKGIIKINGKDVRQFDLNEYWKAFSSMFQHSNLYNITLRENLLLGSLDKKDGIDDVTLCSLLKNMGINIDANIMDLPVSKQFYENGLIFSPGQAQKLNVVRTLLSESQVLILDEPSSTMDVLSEDLILESAFSFSKDKILFFISHRLSNLKKVDKIFFLNEGRIEESGSHEELMGKKSIYFQLYSKQLNKYI